MDPAAEHQQQLRTLRDFLLLYNRLTELCFRRCVCNLNHRLLSGREESCLDACAGKLLHANHRLMGAYVALLPALVQRRAAGGDSAAPAAPAGAQEGPGAAPAVPAAPGPGGPSQGTPGTGR